ncbi:hypothetical protein BMS3Bbin12_02080 [bacterium BMS3Bbin12]|nr:hypothetical protein BMS3Abin12_00505 [bacterium BMS3Abin12]GBE48889.1 hypothetical protein BMS3Bbin12_02080 [bacterium BMS3Bbin12]GBE49793.1 hypothetical protein BMS3Bbin13_00716 [bacterium BMS3Bbin13]HDK02886.1 DUF4124 domain-containing protein [Gammaproteobacteria bacterium]
MRRIAFLLVLVAAPALAAATTVYRWVEPDGTVVFSDQPHHGARKMIIPPANVYEPGKLPNPGPAASTMQGAAPYRVLRISTPAPDATVRRNNGDVTVRMEVKPPLRTDRGQVIALVLDGKRLAKRYRAPQAVLRNVDRGTHTLQAQIVDGAGKVLMSSPSVTFHLMRYSRLSAPASRSGRNTAKPNPNVLSPHPNVLSPHPNVITPPR